MIAVRPLNRLGYLIRLHILNTYAICASVICKFCPISRLIFANIRYWTGIVGFRTHSQIRNQFPFDFHVRVWIIVFLDTVIISTADSFACSVNCRLTAASSSPPSLLWVGFVQWGLSLARVTVMLPCNPRDPHHQHCETDIIIRGESGDVSSVTGPAGIDACKWQWDKTAVVKL